MKITWYAGANEYGYIYPTTVRCNVEDCIQATVAFLEMDQQTFIKQGGRILGLSIEKPFLMSYPVQSEITSDTVVTDVIGYRSGQSYVAKNK